jgi:hypothetical protein
MFMYKNLSRFWGFMVLMPHSIIFQLNLGREKNLSGLNGYLYIVLNKTLFFWNIKTLYINEIVFPVTFLISQLMK